MERDQLRTLVAVVDEGSFDGAAAVLGITPSAVSQRVKALERAVGQVVVRRTIPTVATASGQVLLRLARQQAVLEQEALAALGAGASQRLSVSIAVNADSLATWFGPVLATAAGWDDLAVRIRVDDQDHTRELLRSGEVLAGVTADPDPVGGCRSEPLGAMRYLPVAAPDLARAHRGSRGPRWSELPVVRFNGKDDLQHRHLASVGALPGPMHEVPDSTAFVDAIEAGLGWGMVPEAQLRDRRLVRIAPGHEDVVLHWQVWRLDSARLARVTEAVHRAARGALRSPTGPGADAAGVRPTRAGAGE